LTYFWKKAQFRIKCCLAALLIKSGYWRWWGAAYKGSLYHCQITQKFKALEKVVKLTETFQVSGSIYDNKLGKS
jgi:hypothetical protein